MDAGVGEMIEEGISECNKKRKFLLPDYHVANAKIATHEEISKYLEEIRHREK